ncbi:AMP-binding protein [Streptomyces sp. NBC_00663]|uniref:AMP-binding protein n=1 Tax=Streptomyces sp. NBC_00663 TaxID=2975801 RepID=UPI002E34D627|nr:AMP-binding protein [Streptomyces sp. NBC_00663]
MLDGCTPWPEVFVDRYRAAGHWRGHTLDDLLRGWALEHGPRTALVQGDTRLTYARLNRRVDRMAAGFRLRGLRPGQRVVVQLPHVPELVVTAFALMRAGVIPVFCPLSYRASQVAHAAHVSEAAGYVGPSMYEGVDHRATAAGIAARWPFLRRVFTYEAPGTSSPYGGLATDPSGCHYFPLDSVDAPPDRPLAQSAGQVAFFLLAAETTETPRLIPRTHDDYTYQVRAAAESITLTENDVYLAALPAEFTLTFGCPGILGTLSVGGTAVLAENQTPAECLALIAQERVTFTSVVPAVARHWLEELPKTQADLTSLRLAQLGGAPVDRRTARRLGTGLSCRVQQLYATPEGLLLLTPPTAPDDAALAGHGRPLSPDDEIRIVDTDDKDVPPGTPGELLIRGPHTPRGYYRAPDDNTHAVTPDGYFRTGTVARSTENGTLTVTGRLAKG